MKTTRTIYTGTDAEWDREVVCSLNVLHRSYGWNREIPAVAAFNEWRQAERDRLFAEMAADPERYGDPSTFAKFFKPITRARGGRYVIGTGWVITCDEQQIAGTTPIDFTPQPATPSSTAKLCPDDQ